MGRYLLLGNCSCFFDIHLIPVACLLISTFKIALIALVPLPMTFLWVR
jgi:hypothetical protein